MAHETRRAAREARLAAETAADRAPTAGSAKRSRRRRIWITVAIVLAVLLVASAWVLFRAVTVKSELEQAQSLIKASDDGLSTEARIAAVGDHAAKAAEAAGDPVWRVMEWVPIVGDNLRAVRLSSESIDVLANRIGSPILRALTSGGEGSPLATALPILEAQSPTVSDLAQGLAGVKSSPFLIGPVADAVAQIDGVMATAAPALHVLPALLGADGEKNYLLVFQNNAEALPLGGSAASQTLISASGGKLSIVAQAGSGNFVEGNAVDVPVDESAISLYSPYLVDHVNTTTSRPDFPTAATLLRAFWQRDIRPDRIDGVISIDPIALGRVLLATGPITVGDTELTSKNAVSVLLKDVYARWDPAASKADAAASDAFFAAVASSVFEKIASGSFDAKDMAWAVGTGIDNGDILVWMEDPDVASAFAGQRIAGVLPRDNADKTVVGVYFRDTSASKIDYYMDSSASLVRTCDAGQSTFTATAELHLDISQSAADDLPGYVQSRMWGASQFRTEVFVYGPPGTTFASASEEGREVRPIHTDIDDLGRPVAAFETYLQPEEKASVTATFTGTGDFGPLELRTTPMINPTAKTLDDPCR